MCLERVGDQEGTVAKGLGHVAVLLAQLHRDGPLPMTAVQEGRDVTKDLLASLEATGVVVAHDVGESDLGRRASDLDGMVEALATLGVLRALEGGHQPLELACHGDGVDHDVLGAAWVHHHAAHAHGGLGCVERLVVELAQGLAVDGVAPGGTKLIEVQEGGPVTDLLIRHEGDLERGVWQAGIVPETRHQRADLRHAGLVVSREERAPVAHDDVLAHELSQVGNLIGGGGDLGAVDDACDQVATLVVDHVGPHACGRGVDRGVDVGAEAQGGKALGTRRGRNRRGDVGVPVHDDVLAAQGAQLLSQNACHVMLCRRGGRLRLVVGIGLGVDLHVAQEALEHVGGLGLIGSGLAVLGLAVLGLAVLGGAGHGGDLSRCVGQTGIAGREP